MTQVYIKHIPVPADKAARHDALRALVLDNTASPEEAQEFINLTGDIAMNYGDQPYTPEETAARQDEEKAWQDGAYDRARVACETMRADAYRMEADPLFFQWHRGEVEKQAWLDKVSEIKTRIPKPVANK